MIYVNKRRSKRGYVTTEGYWTDPPEYFDTIVWPYFVKYNDLEELKIQTKLQVLNSTQTPEELSNHILQGIHSYKII